MTELIHFVDGVQDDMGDCPIIFSIETLDKPSGTINHALVHNGYLEAIVDEFISICERNMEFMALCQLFDMTTLDSHELGVLRDELNRPKFLDRLLTNIVDSHGWGRIVYCHYHDNVVHTGSIANGDCQYPTKPSVNVWFNLSNQAQQLKMSHN